MRVAAPARNIRTFVAMERVLTAVLVIGLSLLGWPLPVEGASEEPAVPLPAMPGALTTQALDLSIEHTPLQCVVPTERPKIEAKALPGANLGSGYVFYRATGTKSFYYVFLDRGPGDGMSGVMPRPEPTTKSIDYYLQALNRQRLKTETARYKPPVVKDESSCQPEPRGGRTTAGTTGVAPGPASSGQLAAKKETEKKPEGLTIGLTEEGQNPVPPGFQKEDIARVILVTGAVVTLAAALGAFGGAAGAAGGVAAGAGAAGGGISTGVLVGAGVVVVGAGVALAAGGGGGGGSDATPTVSLTATPSSGTAPLSVTMTANVSSGTSPYTYAWDFGDGQTGSGSSTQIHTYRNPSSTPYSAKVTVTDSKGKTASDSKSITVSGPAPLSFLEADVSYSGPGNVDLKLNLSGQPVGTAYPTSCGPTGNRTARVIVSQPANGSYTVTATGSLCSGQSSVGSISGVFSALTNAGSLSACSALFKDVPVGSTMTACTFSIP